MAKINTNKMALIATDIGPRVHVVAQDPSVQKTWRTAVADTVQAGRSIGLAIVETRTAWRRSAK